MNLSVSEPRPSVLIVDDKPNMLRLMSKVLKNDARILTADNGTLAIRILGEEPVSVVLCDLKMPDIDGLDVLKACKRLRPHAEFVLMTAFASVPTAVEALRLGAYDYLTKPLEPDVARAVVLRALGRAGASASGPGPEGVEVLPGLLAVSPSMQELGDLVRRVADSDATTLVLGETGTGKELVARALHRLGTRADERFVALNCAALPGELLESELFGYARGAFTGATRDRPGLFEEAAAGTLFLDEVAEMKPSLQAKLTRALEEHAVRRLGEARERPVDVRLVAATHRDLESMVKSGTFREDLFYRLNVAVVRVPPLRERREDIELLATHFLKDSVVQNRRRVVGFTQEALTALSQYHWPGNVRQLRAAVERACVVARGERIEVGELPPEVISLATGADKHEALLQLSWAEALERGRTDAARRYLEAVLEHFGGQVAEAAAHAGVERESFYRLMRRYGVHAEAARPGKN